MTREETIEKYMKTLDMTREEAEQLWEDDQEDYIGEEGEEWTRKAKENRRYEQKAAGDKRSRNVVRKVDADKGFVLDEIAELLESLGMTITKRNTETTISYVDEAGADFTIKLTRHRKKKGE